MKKNLILLTIILFFTAKVFGQNCIVTGTIAPQLTYKYAYLYDTELKKLISTPINDHKFNFQLAKPEKFKIMMLSFNTYLMSNYQDLMDSEDYEYPNRAKMIALEDTVEVTLLEKTQNALVKGKQLNKDLEDMYAAIKSRRYALYFKEHSNSPVSLVLLETLASNAANGSIFFSKEECMLYYEELSQELKNSDKGKKIFDTINI
jgi:hypothetical protein